MDKNLPIANLTVGQLRALIQQTVQEAVAEVMIEFAITSELDEAARQQEAEMMDYVRSALYPNTNPSRIELDD